MWGESGNDGYIERVGGNYRGSIRIDGITLPSIIGQYFKDNGQTYLWLRRAKVLEYDSERCEYIERDARPRWEAYLKKIGVSDGSTLDFKGEFSFMRFRYSITGVWDSVFGSDSRHRLNLYVERLPDEQQTIINNINQMKRDEQNKRYGKK